MFHSKTLADRFVIPGAKAGRQPFLYAAVGLVLMLAVGAYAQDKPQGVKLKVTKVEGSLAFYHYIKVTVENSPNGSRLPLKSKQTSHLK